MCVCDRVCVCVCVCVCVGEGGEQTQTRPCRQPHHIPGSGKCQGGREAKEEGLSQEVLDGRSPSVHDAHHLPSLALEVEVEVELHGLDEDVDGDALVGALRDGDPQVRAQVSDETDGAASCAALPFVQGREGGGRGTRG